MKTMTTSEVAKMVMTMFPPTSKYTPNETYIFNGTGNPVIEAHEFKSGNSKVTGSYCNYKTYGQLKAIEKREMVDYIKTIKVDKVTEYSREGNAYFSYYLKGTAEECETKMWVAKKEIKPYNY